jgi:hypothetical protein
MLRFDLPLVWSLLIFTRNFATYGVCLLSYETYSINLFNTFISNQNYLDSISLFADCVYIYDLKRLIL